jgi:hypothetical protein
VKPTSIMVISYSKLSLAITTGSSFMVVFLFMGDEPQAHKKIPNVKSISVRFKSFIILKVLNLYEFLLVNVLIFHATSTLQK